LRQAGAPSTGSILWGDIADTFQIERFDTPIVGGVFAALADVDGDGRLDIIGAGQHVLIVSINAGGRAFRPELIFDAEAVNVDMGDFNSDGKPDIVTTDLPPGVSVRLNTTSIFITTLSGEPGIVKYGERVEFTGIFTTPSPSFTGLTGNVTWMAGSTVLGTSSIVPQEPVSKYPPRPPEYWTTRFSTVLPPGTHEVTILYSGGSSIGNPRAAVVRVERAPSVVVSGVVPASPTFDQPVTITARISSPLSLAAQPAGTIALSEGVRQLASGVIITAGQASAVISSLSGGTHVIRADYSGDANFAPASQTLTLIISPVPSSISLACLPNPAGEGEAMGCTARAMDIRATGTVTIREGLAMLISAVLSAGRADLAISGLSRGRHVLTGAYSGDSNFSAASSPTLAADVFGSLVATLATHDSPVAAPKSTVSVYGTGFATALIQPAEGPLPEELGGIQVTLVDSTGTRLRAPLYFVSPGQINFLTPDVAIGAGRLEVSNPRGETWIGNLEFRNVAPGFFAANGDGKGVAAAEVLHVTSDGAESSSPVFRCGETLERCVPIPIDLGAESNQNYLILFGTGFRNASKRKVTLGGVEAEIVYWGEQEPQQSGRDRMKVRIPGELRARGLIEIAAVADDSLFNPLVIEFQ
jgi:uncharacterized protein (TIGR03437 family)